MHRARESVSKSLEQQLEAERMALAKEAVQQEAMQAQRGAKAMKLARCAGKNIVWDEMAPSCRAAASVFGFMRGMWDKRQSKRCHTLIDTLIRREWFWPWNELLRSFKRAVLDLRYDQLTWQTETLGCPPFASLGFGNTSERYLDMEECRMYKPFSMPDVDHLSVCSDSEFVSDG